MFLKPDAETAVHVKRLLDLGFDPPDRLLTVYRTLAEGLSRAAEAMRYIAVATTMQHPGTTELQMARDAKVLVNAVAPLLGPMVQDMLMLQLRHAMETEAINANERAVGASLPAPATSRSPSRTSSDSPDWARRFRLRNSNSSPTASPTPPAMWRCHRCGSSRRSAMR